MRLILTLILGLVLSAPAPLAAESDADTEPPKQLPLMRWSHMENARLWNAAALRALRQHGRVLVETVPADIARWCPYYAEAGTAGREAFWVGFMSALAKHESTYKPWAVGGGGKWYGLLQIAPATARGYECRAGSGEALKDGGDNLSCAIRIMAVTVPRDGVIAARDTRWRGVAADWGPMRVPSKQRDIAAWVSAQPYCAAPQEPVKPARTRLPRTHGEDR
ncbi:lytic transglycosylase domain-containing protein [Roseobacter sinensis]|uniref:Lytic transglycosylase domain-containing protein n=1 Tax=Roseobacter sinensis TaxID=2931391 RepID=A0ABT3BK50_9RHOB|nr:lytic transglycosylase domain-containing protein [Roseobacter sp. WL0113]MCV3273920.1 lytic transglycosylase domain-containing protein [Roseobacter sp. WL0113]